jgi:hypothetical protein
LLPLTLHPNSLAYPPGNPFSDIAITHWPNALLLRHSLLTWGQVPLWNPQILAGTPFAADPLSGLWYPPLWLAVFLPLPFAFNLLFYVHLAWAGVGAFLLAREEGLSASSSVIAGIAFGGMPKLTAHIGSGHLTLVLAVCWTPWLLIALRRAVQLQSYRKMATAGLLLGLIFLVDPRWAYPSGLLALAYGLMTAVRARKPAPFVVLAGGVAALMAAGVTACLALPLLQFVSLSTRAGLSPSESFAYSLPPSYLTGFVLPNLGGFSEWVTYPGLTILALALLSVPGKKSGGFWPAVFVAALVMALGENTPILPLLSRVLPGLSLLRVPARFLFLSDLALAMMAARGLEVWQAAESRPAQRLEGLVGAALMGAGLGLFGFSLLQSSARADWVTGLVAFGVGLLFLARPALGRVASAAWVLLALLAILDIARVDVSFLDPRPAPIASEAAQEVQPSVGQNAGLFRIYSPSYSLPEPIAAQEGIQLVDGIDPLQLQSTVAVVSQASGVANSGYSVTLPPFPNGDPDRDNSRAVPDPFRLGELNVRYVVAAFPIQAKGLRLQGIFGGTYVFRNELELPRAWVAPSKDKWDVPLVNRPVTLSRNTPNQLVMNASGPGWLILSEAYYPGWVAHVDGTAVKIEQIGGWFRGLLLPPGSHQVDLEFSPPVLWIGLVITALTILAYLGAQPWAK